MRLFENLKRELSLNLLYHRSQKKNQQQIRVAKFDHQEAFGYVSVANRPRNDTPSESVSISSMRVFRTDR